MSGPLLAIEDLSIALPGGADRRLAVEDVSLVVRENEIVCLVGESGSGKSMTAHAVPGLLPRGVRVARGRISLLGRDLTGVRPSDLRALRGRDVAMIFQEPLSALNPLQRIGRQIVEAMSAHPERGLDGKATRERMLALLASVGLPNPPVLANSYPFQLSGGQRQRVMIAMALANDPALLLADEPTTALDVTTQKQILDLIRRVQSDRRMGVLFITHDFGVVADIADRVVVMREGRIVEEGPRDDVLRRPRQAYTRTLVEAVPGRRRAAALPGPGEPLLRIEALRKTYVSRSGLFAPARRVVAAFDVSLTLNRGETVAVVGESGSGKSTLGRMVLRLVEADAGAIRFAGLDVRALQGDALRQYRRRVQIVFQDPFASLNPRQAIGDAVARGPMAFGASRAEAFAEARRLLARVGLDPAAADRFPHEFSGGQRQRISIARALALKPEILVADEAVSALDVSVQAQVLDLLAELKRELQLSMLFITHDLRVAAEIAERVVVMRDGRIVESGATSDVLSHPADPYTRELLDAIPGQATFAALRAGPSAQTGHAP